MLPWLLCSALLAIICALAVRLRLLQKAVGEIHAELGRLLDDDTNVLISVSSGDRHARKLAAELNRHLRLLRRQRQQYLSGDLELKEAVTNIAHDLRTPLTAICGYLDILEQNPQGGTLRYITIIKERAETMKRLTEELFAYSLVSEPGRLDVEEVCLNSALEESAAAYYAAFKERNITPQISLPETKIIRRLDRAALARILGNVLGNALKYSEGDLDICLSASGEIKFVNTTADLDEVQVGKLFNRFYTVNSARNATGLGLAISRGLVQRMGGEMRAVYSGGRLCISVMFV